MIGVFDSGLGGLTILKSIRERLPEYDYLYLGDNARAPYGSRSYEVIYNYTLEAVNYLFDAGCELIILACNTASAKALRTIQQNDLPKRWAQHPENQGRERVLGIIRPTAEIIGYKSKTKHIGVMATEGTVASESYLIEISKQFPELKVVQQACPMWVPIIENNEVQNEGADYFVKKYITQMLIKDEDIDTVLLACTHYPLLLKKIKKFMPKGINIVTQGDIVAQALEDYLHRHKDLASRLTKNGTCRYLTTESKEKFEANAKLFLGEKVSVG